MTATSAVPEVKLDRDPLRILSIAANLLPAEITDARRQNKLRWIVVGLLVVLVAGLGYWDFAARQQTADARTELQAAQGRVNSLQSQKQQYADLSNTKTSAAAIESQLTKLMAQDVTYYELVPAVRTAAGTAGVSITNVTAALISPTVIPAAGAVAGNITIIGNAVDKPKLAAYLDLLAKIPGVTNPYLTGFNQQGTAQGSQYQFTVQAQFTTALYQGRFTPAATTGGK